MSETLDFLSEHDIRQINQLIETLDRSGFDYLRIDVGNIKLTIGKGGLPGAMGPGADATITPNPGSSAPSAVAAVSSSPQGAVAAVRPEVQPAVSKAVSSCDPSGTNPNWTAITATTMGRFYSCPDPSSPPYVNVGDRVEADDTVCLIEVMKLFNAIAAGISGTIAEICVKDGAVVDFGQVLFYVQP